MTRDLKKINSELIKTNTALKESEEKFKAIFDYANDGILVADMENKKFHIVNKMICKMLGYSREELKNLGVMDIHPEESLPYVTEQFQRQAGGELLVAENIPLKRKDGSVIYANVSSTSITLAGKKYLTGIFRDITEFKLAEEKLRKTEEKYRALVSELNEGLFITNNSGTITFANQALAVIYGFQKPEELIGKNFPKLVSPDLREEIERLFMEGFETKKLPEVIDVSILKENGDTAFVQVKPVLIIEESRVVGAKGIVRDITEQNLAEMNLKKAYKELQATQNASINIMEDLQRQREQFAKQQVELEEINSELSVLYKVSSAISSTINVDELFAAILDTVTRLGIFDIERKGAILIVEGDRMKLVSHIAVSDTFVDFHKGMKVGDCLCGLAAKTGEIVISDNCDDDSRHTFRYPGITPHGHIIIPLKARDRVVGILALYIPSKSIVDERKVDLLCSIGNQIGIAIENSMLYEETKALSLHDPLTGLANRTFMENVLKRNFAVAKRNKSELSIVMLDIDYFKKYNDTHGHIAGDMLLKKVAAIVKREIREIDIAVRYGGEEFLIIFPDIESSKAYKVAERIRKTIQEETEIAISLGIASYRQDIQTKEELIDKADNALYQAKQKGRNRIEINT